MGYVKKTPAQNHRAGMASNTANIMATCDEIGRVAKGSLPHWTVAGSRTIRDERSEALAAELEEKAASADDYRAKRLRRKARKIRALGRRPEVIRTEIRDGREIKVCESPDTFSLCEVKIGSYPNRPQKVQYREPTPREQGWGYPDDNYGQPIDEDTLRGEYQRRGQYRKRNASRRGRGIVLEVADMHVRPKVSHDKKWEMAQASEAKRNPSVGSHTAVTPDGEVASIVKAPRLKF